MNSKTTTIILGLLLLILFVTTVIFLYTTLYYSRQVRNLSKSQPAIINEEIYDKSAPADVECNIEQDSICPQWCAPGSDFDCCIKSGHKWVSGRGCYDI